MNANETCASLNLKTSDFTQNDDWVAGYDYNCEYGKINKYLISMTYYNIDLRTILGDMYDKYDKFNLVLKCFSTSFSNGFISKDLDDRGVAFKISGLPFINQTYNAKTGRNESVALLQRAPIVTVNNVGLGFYGSDMVTFGKSQEKCNLTIEYHNSKTDKLATPEYEIIVPNINYTSIVGNTFDNRMDVTQGSPHIVLRATTAANFTVGGLFTGLFIEETIDPDTLLNLFPPNTYIVNINLSGVNTISSYGTPPYSITMSNNAISSQTYGTNSNVTAVPSYINTLRFFSGGFPNSALLFDIVGIPKEDQKNGSRIPLK